MKQEEMEAVRNSTISKIVSNEHVSTRPKILIKIVFKKLTKKKLKEKGIKRFVIAAVLNQWSYNMWEYKYVMGSVPRAYPKYAPRYLWDEENKKVIIRK